MQLVVTDIDVARAELTGRGVDVGEVQTFPWGRFIFFADPDGNAWAIQEDQTVPAVHTTATRSTGIAICP
jgi:predicted enzyme related to lactoylglutathione lyase